jgi:hypothetical protein
MENELLPLRTTPHQAARLLEAVKMLCGCLDGTGDLLEDAGVKACYDDAMAEVKHASETHEGDIAAAYGYPPALQKACVDPFDYAVMLHSGMVVYFREAVPVSPEWVTLNEIHVVMPASKFRSYPYPEPTPGRFNGGHGEEGPFPRGLDVRLDHIAWIADAPHGS